MPTVKKSFDEEFPVLVEDYNKRAENMWKELMEKMDNFDRMLDTRIAVEISKMSDEQKNMTIGQMMENQKNSNYEEQEETEQSNIFDDSVIGKFENLRGGAAAKSVRSTVKKSTRKPPAHQREPPSTIRQSSRKRRVNDTSSDNMSELTSTVKKSSSSRSNLTVPCTPINPVSGGMVNMTPMITPKFNMSTPALLHRTVRRDAKQNEFLVSLNGSPVMGTVTKAAGRGKSKNKEPAPMIEGIHVGGANFSLQLPVADSIDVGGLELEDAHYEKLSILSQGLNKLLSMRAAYSQSESD